MILYSRLFSRIKYLLVILRIKGLRYAIDKLLKKTFQKVDEVVRPVEQLSGVPQSIDINYQKWLNKNYPTQAICKRWLRR